MIMMIQKIIQMTSQKYSTVVNVNQSQSSQNIINYKFNHNNLEKYDVTLIIIVIIVIIVIMNNKN